MKKILILVIFLMLLPLASARESLSNYDALTLKTNLRTSLNIRNTAPDYDVDYITANLTWFPPDDYRQKLIQLETRPNATSIEDNVQFYWNSPNSTILSLEVDYQVDTKQDFKEISEKVDFPILSLPRTYQKYLQEQEIIDMNDDIRATAKRLAENRNDLYEVVFELAKWTKDNINYNLTSMTINAQQKSSWVLTNKQGVCDEITSLFISFCRSLGIPAKFIAGIAYTDLPEFSNPWGPHGWAEVYFPDKGWVPVDVTYGQIGYLDATHIKMQESPDAKQSSAQYYTRGRNIEIQTKELETQTQLITRGSEIKPFVYLTLRVAKDSVGFGSHNLIELKIKNKKNYYVTETVRMSRTDKLDMLSEYDRVILLRPNEEKVLQWIVAVSDNMQKGYKYTFPVIINTNFGETAKAEFSASSTGRIYSYSDIKALLIEEKTEKKPLSIECNSDKKTAYAGENIRIMCSLQNKGIQNLNVKVCFEDQCTNQNVPGMSGFNAEFSKELNITGLQNLLIDAVTKDYVVKTYVMVDVLDTADLTFRDLTYPEKILFGEEGTIEFTLDSSSQSVPQNVTLIVRHKFFEKEWHVPELNTPTQVKLVFNGADLDFENIFQIVADYEDELGKKYSKEESFTIRLANPNFFEKIMVYMNRLENKIEKMIKK